ncbi:MAG: RNA-binding protein, partial [bacterium]|nr:RNA-binding protein [bacterium]
LFVGGLPYSVTDRRLEEIFSEMGTVSSATVISDRDSGQSKGFGFVDMEKDEEAEEAIKKLNDTEIEGRKIVVNVARPREERPSGPRRY